MNSDLSKLVWSFVGYLLISYFFNNFSDFNKLLAYARSFTGLLEDEWIIAWLITSCNCLKFGILCITTRSMENWLITLDFLIFCFGELPLLRVWVFWDAMRFWAIFTCSFSINLIVLHWLRSFKQLPNF